MKPLTAKQRVLNLLREGEPMLSIEIAQALNISYASASEATKELYLRSKIHISEWRRNAKNKNVRVFAFGKHDDAPKSIHFEKSATEPFVPHADVAAAWLRNPL